VLAGFGRVGWSAQDQLEPLPYFPLTAGRLVDAVIGVMLGLATSRQCTTISPASTSMAVRKLLGVLDQDLTLTVPWVGLAVIVAVPLVASLAATAWPAARAAAIRPAVALRTAE
jgi:ABC-type lipoprotein release transport system permease subunit